jgi:hypothetical protein
MRGGGLILVLATMIFVVLWFAQAAGVEIAAAFEGAR